MNNFIMTGVGGYIAPRHLKAIKDTKNYLLAVVDPSDSVGVLDSYFSNAEYFREFERFDRYIDKTINRGTRIDYMSVCSPNYLHDAHIRYGLRIGADVICEKPLVINDWNCDALKEMEERCKKKVFTVLQLRLHPSLIALKEKIAKENKNDYNVELDYFTTRGKWYHNSWKGDIEKSGGLATNIGIHFFDMLLWIFGKCDYCGVYESRKDYISGFLNLEKAQVKWKLSTDYNLLPEKNKQENKTTYRSIKVNGEEVEFSEGFTNLHTRVYEEVLKGNGFGIDDVYPSIQVACKIREKSKKL